MYKRQDLPCAINVEEYFDDTTVGNKHLPGYVTEVVDEYDDITYLILTKNTNGDLTKNTDVDMAYENIGMENHT